MEHLPLAGRRVLVPRRDDPTIAAALRAAGAEVDQCDFTQRQAFRSAELDRAADLAAAGTYHWVALTSGFTVRALSEAGQPLASLIAPNSRTAAVGSATAAAMTAAGVHVDLVPLASEGGAALAAVWPPGTGRVLIPGAQASARALPVALAEKGWDVTTVAVYRTVPCRGVPPEIAGRAGAGTYLALVVTAGSVAEAAATLVGVSMPVVAIGEPSAVAARRAGFRRVALARSTSAADVVAAVVSLVD